jgi:hypothetical protein
MDTMEGGNDAHCQDPLIERAARAGWELVTRVTDTGQVVWEWRNGLAPRPQFLSERIARYWMYDWLAQPENRPKFQTRA